jgi:hypothetical protein
VTRTYESPLDALKQEREVAAIGRDVTSPGRRAGAALVEPLVIIKPEPQVRSKRPYLIAGLCVALVAVAIAFQAPLIQGARTLFSSVNRGMDSTRKPTVNTPSVAPEVSISISVSPADAKLTLDGITVANPLVMKRPADNRPHELVAEAPGHQPLKRSLQFERDLTVMMGLAPVAAATTNGESAKTAEPASETSKSEVSKSETPKADASKASQRVKARKPVAASNASDTSDAPAKASCAVPYTVDEAGIKTFKPECL